MNFLLYLLFIFVNFYRVINKKITTKPAIKHYSHFLPLFWKVGKSNHFFKGDLHRVIFDDYPICMYRDKKNNITINKVKVIICVILLFLIILFIGFYVR